MNAFMGVDNRILLVSKDHALGAEIEGMLASDRDIRYQLDVAFPINSALDAIGKKEYSLVIVDLPQGDKCIEAVERLCAATEKLPLIVLTQSGFKNAAQAMQKGAQFVVSKSRLDRDLFAQKVNSSIERKRIEKELRQKDEILQAVNYAAEIFLTQTHWQALIGQVLERFGKATRSDRIFILEDGEKTGDGFTPNLFAGWPATGFYASDNQDGLDEVHGSLSVVQRWADLLASGKTIHGNLEDFPTQDQAALIKRNVKSVVAVPIFTDHDWWGSIHFEHCQRQKAWTSDELDGLRTAANIFGAAISRQIAEEKLVHLATHDYLTGLPNRMLFKDRFHQAAARADRSGEKIGIICIDLDKFKHVNDNFGHPVGDKVLVEVGKKLEFSLRTSDTCARIGGDEFGVVAEGLHSSEDAVRVMEKLTAAFNSPLNVEGNLISITASMGAALYPDNGRTLEELMKAADKALYDVKGKQTKHKLYNDNQYTWLTE